MARVDEDGGAHAGFLHALADRLGCAPLKHAAWEALQRAEGAYAVPPSEVRHTHGFFDSCALSTQWHPPRPNSRVVVMSRHGIYVVWLAPRRRAAALGASWWCYVDFV
jgi:hypothetical protein